MQNFTNPFNTGSPAEPDRFFGREPILKTIFTFLEKDETQNTFLINGQRRIGKTSILKKVKCEILTKGYSPVYFDLQDKAEKYLYEVLFDLMEKMNLELDIENELTIEDFKKDHTIFEKKYLKKLLDSNRKIVLLFDEFDVLGDKKTLAEDEKTRQLAYVSFVPYLKVLIENKLKIKFIFVIGRSLDDLAEYYSSITKFTQTLILSYFEEDDSRKLIESLTKNSIEFVPETIKKIHEVTHGYPYFLQCLSSVLFDIANRENRTNVLPEEVERHLPEAMAMYEGGLVWFWSGFKPEEKAYLYVIANLEDNNLPTTEENITEQFKKFKINTFLPKMFDVLSKLGDAKIILTKDKNYFIAVPYIQKWIATKHSEVDFQKELQKVDKVAMGYLNTVDELIEKGDVKTEDYIEAAELLRKVLKRAPENFLAQYKLAFCLQNSSTNENEIIEEYERAYEINISRTKDQLTTILKKYYERNNNTKHLERYIEINGIDEWSREKLLQLIKKDNNDWAKELSFNIFCNQWRNDVLLQQKFDDFDKKIEKEKWLTTEYLDKINSFFEQLRFELEENPQNNKISISILKKQYSLKKDKTFLTEILTMETNESWAKKELIDIYFAEWQKEASEFKYNTFLSLLDIEKWILKEFADKVDVFLKQAFDKLIELNNSEEAVILFQDLPHNIDKSKFYGQLLKAIDGNTKKIKIENENFSQKIKNKDTEITLLLSSIKVFNTKLNKLNKYFIAISSIFVIVLLTVVFINFQGQDTSDASAFEKTIDSLKTENLTLNNIILKEIDYSRKLRLADSLKQKKQYKQAYDLYLVVKKAKTLDTVYINEQIIATERFIRAEFEKYKRNGITFLRQNEKQFAKENFLKALELIPNDSIVLQKIKECE